MDEKDKNQESEEVMKFIQLLLRELKKRDVIT